MKTADFLPEEQFQLHMERRRTPKRIAILSLFALVCLMGSQAIAWEAKSIEEKAIEAETPDTDSMVANADLNRLFAKMSEYAESLDPLAEHLNRPKCGWILHGLAEACGDGVIVERVRWSYERQINPGRKQNTQPELQLIVTALAESDAALLELPKRLLEYSGYKKCRTGHTEVIKDRPEALRVEIHLTGKPEEQS
ncbi:MAG: hypothetical protein QGH51_06470 [Planctomycetota bacterium]|jgi:hypothetical protein|nr:hypothetical protein [Planctomycetota bacterium]